MGPHTLAVIANDTSNKPIKQTKEYVQELS